MSCYSFIKDSLVWMDLVSNFSTYLAFYNFFFIRASLVSLAQIQNFASPIVSTSGVDMNYRWYGHDYKLSVYQTLNFWNTKAFLPQEWITLSVFGKTFWNVWSSLLCNFVLYLAFLAFFIRASLISFLWTKLASGANTKFQSWFLWLVYLQPLGRCHCWWSFNSPRVSPAQ